MSVITIRRAWLAGVTFVALLTAFSAQLAYADDAAPNSAAPDAAIATEPSGTAGPPRALMSYKNLFDILQDGGVMMIPLFACSFITLVFVFERAISLRRGRVIPRPFVKRFLHQVSEGKLDRDLALDLCQESGSPIANVFAAAVKKWGRPSVELEQTIIDACDRASGGLRRYVRLFNAVATILSLIHI